MRRPWLPSPALVIATLALLIALGGIGYAAVTLPRNSVGTSQLRNASVTPAKLAKGPAVSVFRASPQSIPHNTSTRVVWTGQTYDVGSMWKPAQPGRLTVRRAGMYAVSATVLWASAGGDMVASIFRNGGGIAHSSPGGLKYGTVAVVTRLKKGDTIDVRAFQTTGGTISLTNCPSKVCPVLTAAWLGP